MMHVTQLRPVMDVVSTGRIPALVPTALQRWDGRPGTVSHIRSGSNHIFKCEHNGNVRFLRLVPGQRRGRQAIEAELAFVLHVATTGVPVAQPLLSVHGQYVEEIVWREQCYYAVMFDGLQGHQWSDAAELPLPLFHAWGATLAQIHRASQAFRPAVPCRRPSWHEQFGEAREWLPPEETLARYELEAMYEWLTSLPVEPPHYGLIHRDLELDNLLWNGERFQVLDFDECVYHWYTADIAAAIDEVWHNPQLDREEWLRRFLQGYQAVQETREVCVAEIQQFLRCIRVLDFAQVLHAYHDTPVDQDPVWLATVRRRSARWLAERRQTFAGGMTHGR